MTLSPRGRRGTLSGAWHGRRGPLLTLVALTAVVSAGVSTTVAYAEAAGASRGLALPLLLLGVFAIPGAGRELALARRPELALARLRGVHGPRLLAFSLTEPLLAIVVGALAGLGAAAVLARTLVDGWAGTGVAVRPWATVPLLAVGVVVIVALAAVLVGSAAVRRESLADQVALQSRTLPSGSGSGFVTVLVLVAAVVSVYRARQGDDPDWVVYAGPALVGLALGQVAVWVVQVTARLLARRTAEGRLPAFLASRRLARAAGVASSLRLLVAAGAVAILAASAAVSVDDWSTTSAKLAVGAPERFDLDGSPEEALALTREADPEGRWTMAAVNVTPATADERRAFVDTGRFARVVGGFLDGTGADEAGALMPRLLPGQTDISASGAQLSVTARAEPTLRGFAVVQLSFDYISMSGASGRTNLQYVFRGRDTITKSRRLPECADGCLPVAFGASSFLVEQSGGQFRQIQDSHPDVHLDAFTLGTRDLTEISWTLGGDEPALDGALEATDDGLRVVLPTEGARRYADNALIAKAPAVRLPVVATEGLDDRLSEVLTPGSNPRTPDVVGTRATLPLVGAVGVLGDLGAALVASSPPIPAAQASVLVRAGAPDSVIVRLERAGGERVSVADARRALIAETGAGRVLVFRLIAAGCLLVALLALWSGQARQRRAFVRDAAALRVVGVPAAVLRGAGLREVVLLVAVSVAATLLAGWAAVALLLPYLPLITLPEVTLPLDLGLRPVAMVGVGVVAALVVGVAAVRARRLDASATLPAGLVRDGGA